MEFNLNEYRDKRVLVTGHTGFKGSWMCQMLLMFGANVMGFSLERSSSNTVFEALKLDERMKSYYGDIRDLNALEEVFNAHRPQYVFHLAAQALVLPSYENPVETYSTNVMGTVNICECVRNSSSVISFLNVTTDKVYENKEWAWGYRESENLNGFDPYSNSKSCSELVTSSYKKSFFASKNIPVSTVRAGNVIGGGDRCDNRIVPDCVRAAQNNQKIIIRNPHSIRPYQHVIEPLYAYCMVAMQQSKNAALAGSYNIGPNTNDCVSTNEIVRCFCDSWQGAEYAIQSDKNQPHEANFLKLDSSLLKSTFGIEPVWSVKKAVENTVNWEQALARGEDMIAVSQEQINCYVKESYNESIL